MSRQLDSVGHTHTRACSTPGGKRGEWPWLEVPSFLLLCLCCYNRSNVDGHDLQPETQPALIVGRVYLPGNEQVPTGSEVVVVQYTLRKTSADDGGSFPRLHKVTQTGSLSMAAPCMNGERRVLVGACFKRIIKPRASGCWRPAPAPFCTFLRAVQLCCRCRSASERGQPRDPQRRLRDAVGPGPGGAGAGGVRASLACGPVRHVHRIPGQPLRCQPPPALNPHNHESDREALSLNTVQGPGSLR